MEGGACPFLLALILRMNHEAISDHQIIRYSPQLLEVT